MINDSFINLFIISELAGPIERFRNISYPYLSKVIRYYTYSPTCDSMSIGDLLSRDLKKRIFKFA